jgi:hypothetical protein
MRRDQPLGPRIVAAPQKNHEQEAGGGDGIIFELRHPASKPMSGRIANEICESGARKRDFSESSELICLDRR